MSLFLKIHVTMACASSSRKRRMIIILTQEVISAALKYNLFLLESRMLLKDQESFKNIDMPFYSCVVVIHEFTCTCMVFNVNFSM